MDTPQRRALVVAPTVTLAANLLEWLTAGNYEVAVVTTFQAATAHLRTVPDVLIAEIRLRDYNGLHLVVRAHARGIPAAVIGAPDVVAERDAASLGATYVVPTDLDCQAAIAIVDRLVSADMRPARALAVTSRTADAPAASTNISWHLTTKRERRTTRVGASLPH